LTIEQHDVHQPQPNEMMVTIPNEQHFDAGCLWNDWFESLRPISAEQKFLPATVFAIPFLQWMILMGRGSRIGNAAATTPVVSVHKRRRLSGDR